MDRDVSGEEIALSLDGEEVAEVTEVSYDRDWFEDNIGAPTIHTDAIEMPPEVVELAYQNIIEHIEETEREYGRVEQIVLGVPQYKALYLYANRDEEAYRNTRRPETVLGDIDIIVIEPPIIHPVIDNDRVLAESLREQD